LKTAITRLVGINQFTMARMSMIPQGTFFNPENMNRLLGRVRESAES
jgi:hypothetical protein